MTMPYERCTKLYCISRHLALLAAQANDAYAQNDLGVMLRFGNGVAQDILGATYWFIKAAKQQDVVALGNLYDIISELELIAIAGNKKAKQYVATIKAIQNEHKPPPELKK